ncbi:MAG: phage tail tape measure protein, partial [Bacteroidetes bacterium]|nr:phage tail tape measure protein [Bacteroidota bacterium]
MSINLNVNGNTAPLEAAVQAAVNRIRKTPIKVTVDDKGATQPLGNMKRGADEFSKSMEAANARIIAFGASMAIINGISDAFKAMVTNVVQVEKALADINVVMGLSLANLDKFSDSLFKVAKETAASFDVAAAAATEYARQGLAVEETLKRTKDALILTRLTGMDSANAVKALTAAMNTYGDQIKDTTQLVSKFAAVDVKFAVSAEDFADAISRTGQAAKSAGVDIDELVGLVTAAQQKTARGGKVIGNSFKTIFTRIGRTDTLNQLENLGIAVRDVEGNTIGAKRILTDLANTFDSLTESQKAQIAQTVGGVCQINVLKAVLSDAAKQNGILANATQISAGATDEAIQKNEQLRSTMSAMASETGLALKEVSAKIGELAIAPGMEKILNIVKGFAEGASDMLGDGESSGNKFATGFLKGLGNIITGPGLVVIVAVFGKLFLKAAQYARESLSSLIGVTSEAQKQKAIQTSLVTLFGQNAALSKEMLRTDISRTEKARIILGLLKAQVVEANALNTIARSSAANLYQKGYGSNLAPRAKPRRTSAQGYIPNYVDAERQQAAQGGYAAGSIRSMNMPGEGSVIYNSAEKVKNFKGMSQPAIMPPKSSKAGENYQQAFGNIHGFDPYAAGGYIPNFAKKTASKTSDIPRNLNSKKLGDLNKDSSLILLTADSSADSESRFFVGKDPKGGTKILNTADLASKRTTGYYQVDVPYYSLDKNDKSRKSKIDLPSIQEAITAAASGKALDIAKQIVGGEKNLKPFNREQIEETFNKGAFKGAAGSAFESAIGAALDSYLFQDYNARTDTSAIDLPYDPKVFQYFGAPPGAGKMGAEVKADLANNLQQGAANKFYQVLAGGRAAWQYKDKNFKDQMRGPAEDAGLERRGGAYFKKGRAYGHIPNFAANSWESEPKWKWSMNSDYIAFQKKKNQEELNKRISKFGNSNISLTGKYSSNLPIARITDPQTGTYTDFTYGKGSGETGNSASIIYSSRGKQDQKGGAFRNFGILGDFTSKQGGKDRSIYSDFDQINVAAGKSPWAMVLRAFPQLKQRIKPGMSTSGEMNIGYDTLPFNSLRSLKMQVSKWVNRNGLQAFLDYSKGNLGLNEKNGILGGTSSGDLFAIGGLRTRMLTRRDKNYLNDSKVGFAASGHIPNFANPLSDAIGREKAAGVPVSKIRIGSHSALMNKSNPIGLGVTNTDDEPNGLRDVFGAANGYVPNYAPTVSSSDVVGYRGSGAQSQAESNAKKYNKAIAGVIKRFETGRVPHKKMQEMMQKLGNKYNVSSSAQDRVAKKTNQLIGTKEKLKAATQRAARSVGLQNANQRFANTAPGKALGSSGGQMALMMGLPMASGFLKEAGAGQQYTGALEGVGSGAAMGMMFGPLGTALGATIGGLYGFIDGLGKAEEAAIAKAKAEIENSKNMGGSLVSVFAEFPEIQKNLKDFRAQYNKIESMRKEEAGKFTTKRTKVRYDRRSGKHIYKEERITDPEAQDAARVYRQEMSNMVDAQFSKALKSLPENYKFSAIGADGETFTGTGKEYAEQLDKVSDPKLKTGMYKSFVESEEEEERKSTELETKRAEGIILQLDLQKAQMAAQKAASMKQLEIKETYSKISDNLKFEEKLMGSLMTDQQKAQNKYLQAINKAEEAYANAAASADTQLRTGILAGVKDNQDIQSLLKKSLGIKEGGTVQDITEKVGSLTGGELSDKLREIAEAEGTNDSMRKAINEMLSLEITKRQDILDLAEENKDISTSQAEREQKVNNILASRSQIIKDLERKNRMSSEGIRSSQKIRGFAEQVAAARRLNAVGPGYQTGREREDFTMSEKGFGLESQITTLKENQKKYIGELNTKKEEFNQVVDQDKLKDLRQNKKDAEDYSEPLLISEQDLELLNKLEKLDAERKKKLEEIEQKIKNINSETDEEINKAKILLDLEQERLEEKRKHETGPGAFGRGLAGGMKSMAEQVETMDYELGTRLPQTFANGLSGAFIEAINGAKDLDDALRDAGLNFLKMIQEAMMQKMVMQMMGGLGFSQ